MKLKYQINTVIKFDNKDINYSKDYTNYSYYTKELIILGNKYLCLSNYFGVFIFDKKFRLIQTIQPKFPFEGIRNLTALKKYPNLFALITFDNDRVVYIYEVQTKLKNVILKKIIKIPKEYKFKYYFTIFSLSNIDLLFFYHQENFYIYNFDGPKFTYKKFSLPKEENVKLPNHDIYILKIIEYTKNHLILLIRDIIYNDNDYKHSKITVYKINCKNTIYLYDIENNKFIKKYITIEEKGRWYSTGLYDKSVYNFKVDNSYFSNYQNIIIIGKSMAYIKDLNIDYERMKYSIYIIDILNGNIKYKFDSYNNHRYRYPIFVYYCNCFKNSIYLDENTILFNGYELQITKNGIKENKIDIINEVYMNDNDYNYKDYDFLKIKKNVFLLCNHKGIKICSFAKNK